MTSIDFVLSPEATARVFDVILCLAKFSDCICIEARREKLVLTALNTSRTACASFAFEKGVFLQSYRFSTQQTLDLRVDPGCERFSCRILNKSLHSAFKGRLVDSRDSESSLERCEVSVRDGTDTKESRLVVKMIYRQGIKKTNKLNLEAAEPIRVPFDRNAARSQWTIGAFALRAFSDYFGAKTEHLDMLYQDDRMHFTSYTEKVVDGKEILKQPLKTSVAIDTFDFDAFEVEASQHIGISVKDFKAIVAHADSLRASVTAFYSMPGKPLLLSYGDDHGLQAEFTLMTISVYRGGSVAPAGGANSHRAKPAKLATRGASVGASVAGAHANADPSTNSATARAPVDAANAMPPPARPGTTSFTHGAESSRVEPTQPRPSVNEESLFVADEDEEERRWGERNFEEDEGELRWDSGAQFRSASLARTVSLAQQAQPPPSEITVGKENNSYVPPTQRLSQIHGMFD